jgi:hypothetical protein
MRAEIEALDPSGLAATTDAVAAAVRAAYGAGAIDAPMQALVVTTRKTVSDRHRRDSAWKPADVWTPPMPIP